MTLRDQVKDFSSCSKNTESKVLVTRARVRTVERCANPCRAFIISAAWVWYTPFLDTHDHLNLRAPPVFVGKPLLSRSGQRSPRPKRLKDTLGSSWPLPKPLVLSQG